MDKTLIVDDEPSIVTLLEYNLQQAGYPTITATNGKDALDIALHEPLAFILLDIMLPEIDGIEVTKQLRQHNIQTPIIMLTAKDDTIDRILGIEIGADDYMAKPFSPREVITRMKAIQRRLDLAKSTQMPTAQLVNGPISIDTTQREVLLYGNSLTLTNREYDLLVYFMQHLDQSLSRDTLLQHLWQSEFVGESRNIDIYISHLREKIEKDPKHPQWLQTIRGVGYRMVTIHE